MYTTRDPPLEVRNAPGIAGVKRSEDVGWITFGKYKVQDCLTQAFAQHAYIPARSMLSAVPSSLCHT
jgi:hypothetical protein